MDKRPVGDLETPQFNYFGQNGSLWWRRNPLPKKGVSRKQSTKTQTGRRTERLTSEFLNGLASSLPVRRTSQHFRATCLRPQTVRCTKYTQGLESRDAPPRPQVDCTAWLLMSPNPSTNHNTKEKSPSKARLRGCGSPCRSEQRMTLAVWPWDHE